MMKTEKRAEKYWLCDQCAKLKGWTFKPGCHTVIIGLCGHCDWPIEQTLTPERDFFKPVEKK